MDLRVFAAPIDDDLSKYGGEVSIGRMAWESLETVRQRAEVCRPSPHPYVTGSDGLPIVVLEMSIRAGRRVAKQLLREDVDGMTIVPHPDGGSLVTVITRSQKVHGLLRIADDDRERSDGLALFLERRRRADGAHALLIVAEGSPVADPHVLGFFESVLREPPRGA